MRYFILPREGLSEDLHAALTRGLGLSPVDAEACRRHCLRYGIADLDAFMEELEEAQSALATAKLLGATLMVDGRGRLCFDLVRAEEESPETAPWQSDGWLRSLFDGRKPA